jgi:hypothetical protein
MKLNKKLELDEKFRQAQQKQQQENQQVVQIEKPNVIVQKEIIQSVIISQPMDVDESNNAAFSDRPVLNNEFMNFKVCFENSNFFFQYKFIIP